MSALELAAAVTLPAAAPPTGKEHLPMDEALIPVVLRHELSRSTSPTARQGGPELYRSTDLSALKMQFCLVVPTHYVYERAQLQATNLSFSFALQTE